MAVNVNRLQMLNELAAGVGSAQQNSANSIMAQNLIGQAAAQPGGPPPGAAGQIAASLTGAQAGGAVQAQQAATQSTAQQVSLAQGNQQLADSQLLHSMKLNTAKSLNSQMNAFSNLGRGLKEELFDRTMTFERGEQGRKFSNERQLADWAVTSAENQEAAMSRLQKLDQAHQQSIYAMTAAVKRLEAELNREYAQGEQALDQASKQRIQETATALREAIAKKEREAKNKAMRNQGMGQLIGTGVGIAAVSIATGGTATLPALAAAGSLGGGVGGGTGLLAGGL